MTRHVLLLHNLAALMVVVCTQTINALTSRVWGLVPNADGAEELISEMHKSPAKVTVPRT